MLEGIDALLGDGAEVGPAVAEVEGVDELVAAAQFAEGELVAIEQVGVFAVFLVGSADATAVG
ncbi:hypothetical protein [Saccharopolyspora sp. ASAGF58]|uniref:hypothetical protein n=1 Tax=Saccharopolyspora sp. ASAGF58 TaxID=2719023 RepID=UPI001B315CEA|nr:hypothetical protein [Saccharopolyspora sp. ASAGF58]